ncbi:reactive intermediate/imine deaminase [Aliivibrio finisterrensis]|uniref:RidA family protein n=1 Tax=Aliivibrio finisterrensis TaxID=511998 RepID=UPI001020AB22|nr:RidA family protein [Aliivibrio finisterrensis]RYU70360.1 reactive intermediate/imine deaminase [Aliivibrio finisterrensis]RYU74222.1 reactive intermediate/imine deaminase [Aliivibrio finisterrensis]RYU76827.1 reactive intermediate/imine deaminase [Aliivibrio finisterrensis]
MSNIIIKNSRNTKNAPQDTLSTQSVAFSHYNNISAQLPINPVTGALVHGDITAQAQQCLENIAAIIKSIGHVVSDVVKINIFLKDISDMVAVNTVYADFFGNDFPTRVVVAVAALPMDGALVQMDALISNGEGTQPQAPCKLIKMARNTENAPQDTLSTQTVAFSHYNNVSAQLPIDPVTGKITTGDIKEQAKQCLKNIKAILESIDVPLDDIVKVNVYLKDLADIDAVNEMYTTFFPDSAIARAVAYVPARTVIVASDLPMNAFVQMDAVVSHGDGTPPQEVEDRHGIVIKANNTENAPLNALSTQTVAFSHYNHISAQLPINSKTGTLDASNIKEQTEQCLNNIKAIVESINHVMDDIVKVNIQLKDITDLNAVNDIYKTFFNSDLPARTVIGVSAIPMNALIQIDAVVSNAEGTPPQK